MNGSNLITVSRLKSLAACPRAHYYRYEEGLRSDREQRALRFGRIYHVGLDMLARGIDLDDVCHVVHDNYAECPDWCELHAWEVECETVLRLLCAYQWYWQNDGHQLIASERTFELPILNPETNAPTPLFKRAGKLDKTVRLPDGRKSLMEHKTTGDDIAPASDYWNILRIDPQVSMYFDSDATIDCILYDVTRKPGIAPKQIAQLDEFNKKIVIDADGNRVTKKDGTPRESGDKEKGYTLQTRVETPQEFGERLAADIVERPEFYFARQEVARTASDIEAFRADLWQSQQLLRERQKRQLWTRNASWNTCPFCEFKVPCFANQYPIAETPAGFIRVENVNPELEVSNDSPSSPATEAPASAAV